jgi:circadian clock protein KaiC
MAPTGIEGLDYILMGGFPKKRMYLIQGDPGVGKTTLALQYLMEGARRGESALYVTLSESVEELHEVAGSHGWDLKGIQIYECQGAQDQLTESNKYTLFHPSEVELGETTRAVLEVVEKLKPVRLVLDSLSELRLLARDALRYRRQILALKHFFAGRNCTVLILDDRTSDLNELHLQTVAHGVVVLQQFAPDYGVDRRRLRVVKMRGVKYRGGFHDFSIQTGGLEVYPRLVAAERAKQEVSGTASSGVPELDEVVGGGLDRGTSTLLMGAAGAGKSALALQYSMAAASRGEKVFLYTFDERLQTLLARANGIGMELERDVKSGLIQVRQIDPAELSPGEFVHSVRKAVEESDARMVVIDSLNGYLNAMPQEKFLTIQLHELLTFLGQRSVVTIMVVSQHGLIGSGMNSPVDVSYLADTVILLRYYESFGEVHKAVSVLKKRSGYHECSIRELTIDKRGLHVGPALSNFHGILTGVPTYQSGPSVETGQHGS